MKYISLTLALLGLSLVPGWADATTNRLSFHLFAKEPLREALIYGRVDLAAFELLPDPVLSDADFTAYDPTNHVLWVTAEAAKRVAKKRMGRDQPSVLADETKVYHSDSRDTPFVIKAFGKPIYWGVFSSLISSTAYSAPTVWTEPMIISADRTNSVAFFIGQGLHSSAVGQMDERDDRSILKAVKELALPPTARDWDRERLEVLKAWAK